MIKDKILVIDDEAGSGRRNATGSTAFGDTPFDGDYSDGDWDLSYTIDTAEADPAGITLTFHDNVGNWNDIVVNTLLDNQNPVLDAYVSENSSYLYIDAGGVIYFGDEMTSNMTQGQFEAVVRRAKEYIAAGDIFQVVLSQRLARPTPVILVRDRRGQLWHLQP